MDIPCKTSGCDEKISYRPMKVYGVVEIEEKLRGSNSKSTKIVYLSCPKGHTHPYEVPAD